MLYVLHKEAEADLRDIAHYTRHTWGMAQALNYKTQLTHCIEALAKGTGFYKPFNTGRYELRMLHCQHHYIFLLPRNNASAVVLAILHERMDILTRLKTRLV